MATTKYYRSQIAGLAVVVDQASDAEAPKTVRFTPILQRYDGDMEKFGYLETDSEQVHKILKDDPNVVELKEAEYKDVFERADSDKEPNVRRVGY